MQRLLFFDQARHVDAQDFVMHKGILFSLAPGWTGDATDLTKTGFNF